MAGLRFAVGLGVPLAVGVATGQLYAAGFAALGAMFALASDTRRGLGARLGGIGLALLILMAAAVSGVLLRGHAVLQWSLLAMLVFLSGLPGPSHAYLGFVGKFAASAVVLVAAGFPATPEAGLAIAAGGAWAAVITAVDVVVWRSEELGTRPLAELAKVFAGDVNSPVYALMLAGTVLAGTLTARWLGAVEPGWVGLTVLFVMHVNDSLALQRIGQRVAGTLAGFAVVVLIVPLDPPTWLLALLVTCCAFFFPISLARNYLAFSFVITVLVLLLIDLLLAAHGGDAHLLRWRVYDTLVGAAWAAAGLLAMRLWRRMLAGRAAS